MLLQDRVAIVSGVGPGMGRDISLAFAREGADLVLAARTPGKLEAVASEVEALGRRALCVPTDITDEDQCHALAAAAVDKFGRIDVLVNNAGGAPATDAATASPRFSESIIRLNLLAPLNFSQLANRVMQQQESGGTIINIASVSAIRPSPGTAAYGAAKAGLVNLCTSLAVEWAPRVRVVAVISGLVVTEQAHLHYGDEAGIAAVGRTIPLGRMAVPADIGNVCLFLASPLASYISGSAITVHGGGEAPAFLAASNAD